MGVSQQLADTIASDGYAPTAEGEAVTDAAVTRLPSLEKAEPRTTFDPRLLHVERFAQLPMFPRALFGW